MKLFKRRSGCHQMEPLLNAAEIGVTVKDGIVTLTGTVDSYARELEAETATKKVGGVKAIIEKIDIHIGSSGQKDDHAIATEVVNAFAINWSIPKDKVTIKVEDGWVSLGGELPWDFQKEAVQKTVKNLPSIKGIINTITIKADSKDKIEKRLSSGHCYVTGPSIMRILRLRSPVIG